VGLINILLVGLISAFAPLIAPYDPLEMNVRNMMAPPSLQHLFGTDLYGRDLFSRVIYGARSSMIVGATVALASMVCGSLLGLLAAYYARLDMLIMRVTDILLVFPGIILALAIVAMLGPSRNAAIIALSITSIPRTTRLIYSYGLKIREEDFVLAAHAIGAPVLRILCIHIFPNAFPGLIVQATIVFVYAVLGETALSFLGAGTPPPFPSWGNIIAESRDCMYEAPWVMVIPGLVIALTVFSLNALGDALRDILDPRLRRLRE